MTPVFRAWSSMLRVSALQDNAHVHVLFDYNFQ